MGILSSIFGSGPKPVQTPFSQTNSSTSSGTSSGSSTGTFSGTTTPIAPEGYIENLFGIKPESVQIPDLSRVYLEDALMNRGAPTLSSLAAMDPSAYGTPADVSAQQVSAQRGAEFMDAYRNPFEDQVVQSALGDLERLFGQIQNASNMQQAAAGAFGGGRHALREAAVADDYLRTVGATSGGLRAQGFNTAANLGMQDASRALTADQTNAANALAAATFNNQQQQQRNMFDANLGMAYNDQRDNLAFNLANLDLGAQGQGFNQNLAWLQQFAPLFGTSNTGTETGTTSGATTGTTTGNTSGYGTQIQQGSGGLLGSLGGILTGLGGLGWNPFADPEKT